MWTLGLIQTDGGGIPKIDLEAYLHNGRVFIGSVGGWGAFLLSGTATQLSAINALPEVIGICTMTHTGDVKWAELDNNIGTAIRNKLNTWLTARGYSTIPAGWTNRQAVLAVFRRLNPTFEIEKEWVAD